MARVADLGAYCAQHGLKMITIADLIAYRRRTTSSSSASWRPRCPPASATSRAVGYRSLVDDKHHVALVKGDVDGAGRRARPRALRVPHGRRLPLAALRLRRAARVRAGDDRARGPRRAALPRPGGARASACSTSCAPTSCRRTGSTPSTPTSSSACPPTCATTASARRSSSTSGCRRSGSSPTTRRRSAGWRATACRSPRRSRSSTTPNPHNEALPARQGASAWATPCTTRGLPLDEEMLHQSTSRTPRGRAERRRRRAARSERAASRSSSGASTRSSPSASSPARGRGFEEAGVEEVDVFDVPGRLRAAARGQLRGASPAATRGSPASAR